MPGSMVGAVSISDPYSSISTYVITTGPIVAGVGVFVIDSSLGIVRGIKARRSKKK